VRQFKPGDEVYARPADGRIGAFAEFCAIKEDDVAIKPKALTMEEAASIPLVGLTAWQALIERASLKQGQKVLIHAGPGGVGTIALQRAKPGGPPPAGERQPPVGAAVATLIRAPPRRCRAADDGAGCGGAKFPPLRPVAPADRVHAA